MTPIFNLGDVVIPSKPLNVMEPPTFVYEMLPYVGIPAKIMERYSNLENGEWSYVLSTNGFHWRGSWLQYIATNLPI